MQRRIESFERVRAQNVRLLGNPRGRTIVFGHGFGWSQKSWRLVAPAFTKDHTVVLLDHIGASTTDPGLYDHNRYSSLYGHAADLNEVLRAYSLSDVIYVGHSMSGMIGALAAGQQPERFAGLVLVSPSARYVDDVGYRGGLTRAEAEDITGAIASDVGGWANAMAAHVMKNSDRPWLASVMRDAFARMDPTVAAHSARVVFLGDYRTDALHVRTPTTILQAADDAIVPLEAAEYLQGQIAGSDLRVLCGTGHALNLSAPWEVISAVQSALASAGPSAVVGRRRVGEERRRDQALIG
jgi:sigma-B regulation protein RsbQ